MAQPGFVQAGGPKLINDSMCNGILKFKFYNYKYLT